MITDKPCHFESETIELPFYHRGHLSLFPGTVVTVCFLPKIKEKQLSELIISPIPLDSWADLWRISIALKEREGLVHDVFEILARNEIDVITSDSVSGSRRTLHSIEIIVNAKLYGGRQRDRTHKIRVNERNIDKLLDLEHELLTRLIDDIAFHPSGEPRLTTRRVIDLFNAQDNYYGAQTASGSGKHPNQVSPLFKEARVQKGPTGNKVTIKLPEDIRDGLRKSIGIQPRKENPNGEYLMVSDPADRFLHVYFMRKGDKIIAPTIEHKDKIGAIEAITKALYHGNFDILTFLTRVYHSGTVATSEFVLLPPKNLQKERVEEIQRKLEESLTTDTLVTEYDIGIDYPANYRSRPSIRKLLLPPDGLRKHARRGRLTTPGYANQSTIGILNKKYELLTERLLKPNAHTNDKFRFDLVTKLRSEDQGLEEAFQQPDFKQNLFVSHNFDETEKLGIIEEEAGILGFNVVTAKEIPGANNNRQGVCERMKICQSFLGVWTEQGGVRCEEDKDKFVPSNWLAYEFAIAEFTEMRWELLISKQVHEPSWRRLAGERPHIFFNGDFRKQVKTVLQALSKKK